MAKRILVVDDEFGDLQMMNDILVKEKLDVVTATNGVQALDALNAGRFDLILIDIKMPTLSGYDLLRLLRERLNGGTRIAYVSIIQKADADMGGVDGFIQKPFSSADFMREVKKLLQKR